MEPTFANLFYFVFFAIPFIAVIAHRKTKGIWHQGALVAGYSVIGWLILLAASWYADRMLASWFEHLTTPTTEQVDLFNRDGASKSALLLFGLPMSFVYVYGVWLLCRIGIFVSHKLRNRE
jgi:amino acid transporter